jgi:hypothetical protein
LSDVQLPDFFDGESPLTYEKFPFLLAPLFSHSVIESLPAFSAALAIPDLATLIFSAYCSGIRVDFQYSPMVGPFGLPALDRHGESEGVTPTRLPESWSRPPGDSVATSLWLAFIHARPWLFAALAMAPLLTSTFSP